jgi:DNA-binding response OmpR family regulator
MGESKPPRPRLLLVEDDRATYTAIQGILTLRGWDVVVATTVATARVAMAGPLDAAVLDLMLPDGAGEQLLAQLRGRFAGIPIAVTTGVSDPDRLGELRQVGPTSLLRKPISIQDLLQAITLKVA